VKEAIEDFTSRPADFPAGMNSIQDSEDEVSLRQMLVVPLKRKRIIAACAAAGLLAGILATFAITPRYRATATIELNEDKQSGVSALSDLASEATGGADELKVKMQTEIAVIKDDSIALAVMSKMGMLRVSEPGWFKAGQTHVVTPDQLTPKQREALISAFESHLKVEEVENSRLISITYTSRDPKRAADVANEVVAEYKSYLLSSNFNSSKEVSQWLADQLSGLAQRVASTEAAVSEFERSHNLAASMVGVATLSGGGSGVAAAAAPGASGGGGGGGAGNIHIQELDRLSALNEEVTQAETVRMADEAIYRLTATQNPDVISSLSNSSLLGVGNSSVMTQGNGLQLFNSLREQLAMAKVAYADAATKYGVKNPHLIEIQNQIDSLNQQIQTEMEKIRQRAKNDLTLAEENERALKAAFQAQSAITSRMNDDILKLGVLMEQASSSRELYNLLYARLQEANIDSGSSATNVTVADPARPPGRPWMPKPVLFSVSGLFGGLLLGTGFAFLLESQDDTVADSFEVEALTNLPVIGLVPFHRPELRTLAAGNLATETSPFLIEADGPTAESLRSIRSGLLLSGIGRKLKVIAFTSALPGESKSYTCYNLGLAFAATGRRVLIIDADLRRSQQHVLFRTSRGQGLVDLLAGMTTFDETLQPHPIEPNLTLLSAGRQSPLASEILGSGEIGKVLEIARQRFDVVFVDNAPVLPVADAIVVGTYCDGVIGIVRAGKTSKKALRRFIQSLARNRVHVLGMVIGAVDMSATEYRSVYGYNVQSYYGEKV
jgi:capsular exopolysaccharide synthesis family protein